MDCHTNFALSWNWANAIKVNSNRKRLAWQLRTVNLWYKNLLYNWHQNSVLFQIISLVSYWMKSLIEESHNKTLLIWVPMRRTSSHGPHYSLGLCWPNILSQYFHDNNHSILNKICSIYLRFRPLNWTATLPFFLSKHFFSLPPC